MERRINGKYVCEWCGAAFRQSHRLYEHKYIDHYDLLRAEKAALEEAQRKEEAALKEAQRKKEAEAKELERARRRDAAAPWRSLHRLVSDHFSFSEISTVLFELGEDVENVPHREQGKELFIWQLLQYLRRRGRLLQFIDACKNARPRVEWPSLTKVEHELGIDNAQTQSSSRNTLQTDTGFKLTTEELEASVDALLVSDYEEGDPHHLVFMDIDKFTQINRRFGVEVGDQVIEVVSKLFKDSFSNFGSGSFTARWEQDEFIALFHHDDSSDVIKNCLDLLLGIKNYNWSQIAPGLYVRVSIGIAKHQPNESAARFIIRAIYGSQEAKKADAPYWRRIYNAPIALASNVSLSLVGYHSGETEYGSY